MYGPVRGDACDEALTPLEYWDHPLSRVTTAYLRLGNAKKRTVKAVIPRKNP
jgi:hypothetical protein